MADIAPNEYYKSLLSSGTGPVNYEIAAALFDSAKLWALLAERLMFAVESEGLSGLDPSLAEEYQSACLTEPAKFSEPNRRNSAQRS